MEEGHLTQGVTRFIVHIVIALIKIRIAFAIHWSYAMLVKQLLYKELIYEIRCSTQS